MSPLMQQLEATAGFIQSKINATANTAIILGSGLGNLSSVIETEFSIPYSEIPNFPVSTVEGHKGRLILGTLNGKKVWVMEGRTSCFPNSRVEIIRSRKFIIIKRGWWRQ